jgi:hypothetical protein
VCVCVCVCVCVSVMESFVLVSLTHIALVLAHALIHSLTGKHRAQFSWHLKTARFGVSVYAF